MKVAYDVVLYALYRCDHTLYNAEKAAPVAEQQEAQDAVGSKRMQKLEAINNEATEDGLEDGDSTAVPLLAAAEHVDGTQPEKTNMSLNDEEA